MKRYGLVCEKQIIRCTKKDKLNYICNAVSELLANKSLNEVNIDFDSMQFIVHETDGRITVGMKWETED